LDLIGDRILSLLAIRCPGTQGLGGAVSCP
jgi:hypothetical protein